MTLLPRMKPLFCDCMQPNCPYCDIDGSRAKAHDELIEKINNKHNQEELTYYDEENKNKSNNL